MKYYNPITKERTFYAYRFKTKEEFEDYYGTKDWYDMVPQTWADGTYDEADDDESMDYLYGTNFIYDNKDTEDMIESYDDIRYLLIPRISGSGNWYISGDMLTHNDQLKTFDTIYTNTHNKLIYEALDDLIYKNIITNEKTKYPFRFKTNDEFEKEYGEYWKTTIRHRWNDIGSMDYLFGKDYESDDEEDEINDQYYDGNTGDWMVSFDMLTNNKYNLINDYFKKPENIYENNNNRYYNNITNQETIYPYRIKTKKELISEYGEDWEDELQIYYDLTEYFGEDLKDFSDKKTIDIFFQYRIVLPYDDIHIIKDLLKENNEYSVSKNMFKKNKLVYENIILKYNQFNNDL